ncbi:hypothetical protein HDU86_001580 [Geranomyces michiganensis]|nr:hypothetical protein HDU86_001580 [Geranomyces michiganensis]
MATRNNNAPPHPPHPQQQQPTPVPVAGAAASPPLHDAKRPPLGAHTHHDHVPFTHSLAAEIAAATTAGAIVSPIITIIDRAIFLNASGAQRLASALLAGARELVAHPVKAFRQPACLFMFAVYAGTYATANTVHTICDYEGWDWFYPKFIATSVANVGLCVAKDVYFTKWFGTGKPKAVPMRSYALYTSRDVLTVFASFNLPPILADSLAKHQGIPRPQAEVAAQLLTPCAVQLVSTPMHLVGMDFYNRPHASAGERWANVRREYAKSTIARVGRIFAAFGIGGVANQRFRVAGQDWLRTWHG